MMICTVVYVCVEKVEENSSCKLRQSSGHYSNIHIYTHTHTDKSLSLLLILDTQFILCVCYCTQGERVDGGGGGKKATRETFFFDEILTEHTDLRESE